MTNRKGNRKPSSRAVPTPKSANADFWKSFGASNPNGTTPSTPTTPPTRSGSRAARTSEKRDARLIRNLELAGAGNDTELLPYRPTQTINPQRPRTLAAGYDAENEVLYVRFRDGVGYEYENVSRSQWREFKNTPSPGRYINRELNHHPYAPADW